MTYLPKSLLADWDSERITADTDPALQALEQQRLASQGSARPPQLPAIGAPQAEPMPQVQAPVEDNTPVNWGQAVPTLEDLGIAPPSTNSTNPQNGLSTNSTNSGMPVSMPTGASGSPSGGGTPYSGPSGGPVAHSSREAFIASMLPYAKQAEAETGIPAEVMMAINLNEQGWQYDAPGQNYFGIKGSNPRTGANTGPVNTWEDYGNGRQNIQDTFRAYDSPAESYADFGQFLKDNSRYQPALQRFQQTGDAQQLVRDIHAAGYATDPDWSSKIISIANGIAPVARGSAAMLADNAPDHIGEPNKMVPNGTIKGMPVADALRLGGQFQLGGPDDVSGGLAGASQGGDGSSGDNVSGGYPPVQTVSNGDGTPLDAGRDGYLAGRDAATGFPGQAANGGGNPPVRDNAWASGDLNQPVASGSTWQDTATQPDHFVDANNMVPDSSVVAGARADPGGESASSPPVEQPQDPWARVGHAIKDALSGLFGGGDQNSAPDGPQRPATPANFNLGAAEQGAQHAGSVLPDAALAGMQAANAGFDAARQPLREAGQAAADQLGHMANEQDTLMAEYNDLMNRQMSGENLSPDDEWRLAQLTRDVGMGTFAGGLEGIGKLTGTGLSSAGRRGAQEAIKAGAPGAEEALRTAEPTLTESLGDLRRKVFPQAGRPVPEMASGVVSGAQDAGQYDRYYHGTGSDFARPEPGKFDPNGLFGPALYVTDHPVVAGSGDIARTGYAENSIPTAALQADSIAARHAQLKAELDAERQRLAAAYPDANPYSYSLLSKKYQELSYDFNRADNALNAANQATKGMESGPNIRPIDVPRDLNLLDADAPATAEMKQAISAAIDDPSARQWFDQNAWKDETGQQIWDRLNKAPTRDSGMRDPEWTNKTLAVAGYDGIKYAGGKRIPMTDAAGNAIEHNAIAIFPESLDKIRNATAGTPGGSGVFGSSRLGTDLGNAATGAIMGNIDETLNPQTDENGNPIQRSPQERLARAAAGATLATLAGRRMARGNQAGAV